MSGTLDLERRLATWLEQDGPADVPAAAVEAALAQARTIRQPRAWLTRSWWERRPLVAAPARAEAGAIEPDERIPTFPVARSALRPAWALLLLAGLLAALVGGALLVGSQQQRRLPAVVPPVVEVFECPPGSTPDEPGPVDQARPPHDSDSALAFDRRAGRLVVVVGAETWTFDVCTNTWMEMHPNRQPPSSDWAQLVYDVDSDITILASNTAVWAYDLQADTWTEKGAAPTINWVTFAYDPVSDLVVAADYSDLGLMWTYEVETDTWAPIDQANAGPSDSVVIAYDTSVDRLVAYGDGPGGIPPYEMWLFDIRTGTWARSAAERPAVSAWWTAPSLAYDEAAGKTVVLLRYPETAYDATADRWEVMPDTWSHPGRMVYDSVNRRLVGLGMTEGMSSTPPGVVEALDLVKGEHLVLLEPGDGLAAP